MSEPAADDPGTPTPATAVDGGEPRPAASRVQPERRPRLHQPWRGPVAVLEVLAAVAMAFAAVWSWRQGVVPVEFPPYRLGQPAQEVTRYFGNWIAGAIALAVLAGFALIDAIRQAVLAARGRGQGGSAESG